MSQQNWLVFDNWHELLDFLCAERGYANNLDLANRLCAAQGNQSQSSFNTAMKNLQNWRQGVHIPQRRNFALLGKLLKVDDFDGLRPQWNTLYQKAKVRHTASTEGSRPVAVVVSAKKRWLLPLIAGIVVIIGLSSAWMFGVLPVSQANETSEDFKSIEADYRKNVTLKVGQALIIHGARGNNCGPAPDWDETKSLLPELVTGTLSDGGLGTRYSRQCGGRVPARAVLFKATKPGIEQTSIYGDPVTINVQKDN